VLGLAISAVSAQPASAAFHLWDIEEVYSNEDGTIQYIELFTTFPGQEFIAFFDIQTQDASLVAINTYIFPTDLAPGTAGKTFLLGTQGLANLNQGSPPDYIIADGFVDDAAFFINFAGFDRFDLDGLPRDGVNSLDGAGQENTPTPTNYAGQVLTVPEPAAALGQVTALLSVMLFGRAARRRGVGARTQALDGE
jgi:hypothetical protein